MSVARVCEAGNQVMFGVDGGVIRNLATGHDTPLETYDGVYVLYSWVAPVAVVQQASACVGQP